MFTKNSALLSTLISKIITDSSVNIGSSFNPTFDQKIQKLFANDEQGFYYDPNDLSTLYQDAAGTVPVTGVGQAVGLVLDKSKGLVKTEINRDVNFDNPSVWVLQPTGSSEISVSGGLISCNSTTNARAIHTGVSISANTRYVVEIDVVSYTRGDPLILISNVEVPIPKSVGKHIISFTTTITATSFGVYAGKNAVGGEWAASSLSITSVGGNHAYQSTSASRPILRKNVITGANYLEFDGSDDFLQTNNINFTATDKVSLFAGVRKLSDVALGMVFELSAGATNNGAFYITAPNGVAQPNFSFGSRGTSISAIPSTNDFAAPYSAVLTAYASIGAPITSLKVNNAVARTATNTQGTGNYGNYPLYICRRAGTSLPFNGHIYGLIGIGKLTTDDETAIIEKELAKRLGVTLNV